MIEKLHYKKKNFFDKILVVQVNVFWSSHNKLSSTSQYSAGREIIQPLQKSQKLQCPAFFYGSIGKTFFMIF